MINSDDVDILLDKNCIEIKNILTKNNIEIEINLFFSQFIEYRKIVNEINRLKAIVINKDNQLQIESNILYYEEKLINFMSQILKLAQFFQNIPISSKRLQLAKKLFFIGKLEEANQLLDLNELENEQATLLEKLNKLKIDKHNKDTDN